jgi:hypothetical protein
MLKRDLDSSSRMMAERTIRPHLRGRARRNEQSHEGQKVSYDVVSERGKLAAANLQNV